MKSGTLQRRAPLKRTGGLKRSWPRRKPGTCLDCHRLATRGRLCEIHAADAEWSRQIRERDGNCQARGFLPGVTCWGRLEAMHLVGRGEWRTRWLLANGAAGCTAHHAHLTDRPKLHHEFCETRPAWWEVSTMKRDGVLMDPTTFLEGGYGGK